MGDGIYFPQRGARALLRRFMLRTAGQLDIACAVRMVRAILLPNRNLIGWVMTSGFRGVFGLFPVGFLALRRFGRVLRRDDSGLAAQMFSRAGE